MAVLLSCSLKLLAQWKTYLWASVENLTAKHVIRVRVQLRKKICFLVVIRSNLICNEVLLQTLFIFHPGHGTCIELFEFRRIRIRLLWRRLPSYSPRRPKIWLVCAFPLLGDQLWMLSAREVETLLIVPVLSVAPRRPKTSLLLMEPSGYDVEYPSYRRKDTDWCL